MFILNNVNKLKSRRCITLTTQESIFGNNKLTFVKKKQSTLKKMRL